MDYDIMNARRRLYKFCRQKNIKIDLSKFRFKDKIRILGNNKYAFYDFKRDR